MSNNKMYQLKERTFVNASRDKVVPENSPEAAHLLGPAGWLIDHDTAVRLGLKKQEPKEDKAQKPAEDKSQQPEEEKEPGKSEVPEETDEDQDSSFEGADFSSFENERSKRQALATLTVLHNAGVEEEHIPMMRDADLIEIDGISRTRLDIIRRLYPQPAKENEDATDDSDSGSGTL